MIPVILNEWTLFNEDNGKIIHIATIAKTTLYQKMGHVAIRLNEVRNTCVVEWKCTLDRASNQSYFEQMGPTHHLQGNNH